ncbi:MAG: helix-turn-helix transcriptional regulator [Rhizonema sp. PD38]|nr:helix-turn-helix transcriptional regulator [Rhizonema sp. PD38]
MQEYQNRLTQLIEQLLQEGWTQTALAEAIGVDISTIYRWLRSKTIPEADSKNFRQLAKLSGGNNRSLQVYLKGEISLSAYRQGLEKRQSEEVKNRKSPASERIKKEVLAKIYLLDPLDIAEVISSSVAFLARQE